jgi:hypothetical protein
MLIMETPARETRMRNTGGVILSSLEPELVAG